MEDLRLATGQLDKATDCLVHAHGRIQIPTSGDVERNKHRFLQSGVNSRLGYIVGRRENSGQLLEHGVIVAVGLLAEGHSTLVFSGPEEPVTEPVRVQANRGIGQEE